MEKSSRNTKIERCLEEERIPVLPFELITAKEALKAHIETHHKLAAMAHEAMSEVETFHDNAEAEAAESDSHSLARAASYTNKIINNAEVFQYEASPEDGVTLGSVVEVYYGDDETDTMTFFLTGISQEVDPEVLSDIENSNDINTVTLNSPVGKAILGAMIGQEVETALPNGRTTKFTVTSIRQI